MSTPYWIPLGADTTPRITYSTTPPATPADGDIWILPADTTNGIMWQFRYRAASASAYKWEFVGGPPAFRGASGASQTLTASYAQIAAMPSFTVPRTGDYFTQLGSMFPQAQAAATTDILIGPSLNGANPLTTTRLILAGTNQQFGGVTLAATWVFLALAAGTVVTLAANATQSTTLVGGLFSFLPVRVS